MLYVAIIFIEIVLFTIFLVRLIQDGSLFFALVMILISIVMVLQMVDRLIDE